jgi:hypothetical protein
MQQRLLLLLETAMIDGKARERSLPVSRSLSNTTTEVPFLDLFVSNTTGDNLIDVIERIPEGKTFCARDRLVYMSNALA